MCTKNHDHLMYNPWDAVWDRYSFCHIGSFFAFLPPKDSGNQNFEKLKKHLQISWLHTWCALKTTIIWYKVPEMRSGKNGFFLFWVIFLPFYSPYDPENQNFEKMKNVWRYHQFTKVYQWSFEMEKYLEYGWLIFLLKKIKNKPSWK